MLPMPIRHSKAVWNYDTHPCRPDSFWGCRKIKDIAQTMTDASLCGLGQSAALAISSAMHHWPELFNSEGPNSTGKKPYDRSNSPHYWWKGSQCSPGTTLLHAAQKIGIKIPTICYHDYCTSNALCRFALLSWRHAYSPARLVVLASIGMKVHTQTERVRTARRTILKCWQPAWISPGSGNQDLFHEYQVSSDRFPEAETRKPTLLDDNSQYIRDYARCILCGAVSKFAQTDSQYTYAINSKNVVSIPKLVPFTRFPSLKAPVFFAASALSLPHQRVKTKHQWLMERDYSCEEIMTSPGLSVNQKHLQRRSNDSITWSIVRTVCPYCGVGCNMNIHIRDNFIYKSRPHLIGWSTMEICVLKGVSDMILFTTKTGITVPLVRKTKQSPWKSETSLQTSECKKLVGMKSGLYCRTVGWYLPALWLQRHCRPIFAQKHKWRQFTWGKKWYAACFAATILTIAPVMPCSKRGGLTNGRRFICNEVIRQRRWFTRSIYPHWH